MVVNIKCEYAHVLYAEHICKRGFEPHARSYTCHSICGSTLPPRASTRLTPIQNPNAIMRGILPLAKSENFIAALLRLYFPAPSEEEFHAALITERSLISISYTKQSD